ncbi:hypothetical protein [Leptolyngbya sp. 7M]|uniref:hypothetical protein n=1 Tax=Leptolyngbya sp. 7M TaxID=2812896 RepID=UPI001B8CCFDE|nr:hypothetical protein [Leptolyngbya sp. 7M]QYO68001.1 hypothetical protein JVX88_15235 [Leptolyngbya sp. 7M]
MAEYSTQVEPQTTAKTSYLTNDHLGSPRITTDQFGQTISRRDFMPFGVVHGKILGGEHGTSDVHIQVRGLMLIPNAVLPGCCTGVGTIKPEQEKCWLLNFG